MVLVVSGMSLIDKKAPDFEADAFKESDFTKIKLSDFKGKWMILFFYPADFTFVCPTELEGFAKEYEKFQKKNCEIISVSTDTVFTHKAWIAADPRLKGIKYYMASDRNSEVSRAYDVFESKTGNSSRGLFIIDPEGVVKYLVVTQDNVGRSTEETYRVLSALQTGGLCPVNWQEGEKLLGK